MKAFLLALAIVVSSMSGATARAAEPWAIEYLEYDGVMYAYFNADYGSFVPEHGYATHLSNASTNQVSVSGVIFVVENGNQLTKGGKVYGSLTFY